MVNRRFIRQNIYKNNVRPNLHSILAGKKYPIPESAAHRKNLMALFYYNNRFLFFSFPNIFPIARNRQRRSSANGAAAERFVCARPKLSCNTPRSGETSYLGDYYTNLATEIWLGIRAPRSFGKSNT